MAGGGGGAGEAELSLDSTPTWIVAAVCTVIISVSLFFERFLNHLGKIFLKRNQKPLFQALQKMKGELMVMGFISLMLVVTQGTIQKICIPASYSQHMRPCNGQDLAGGAEGGSEISVNGRRRLLSEGASDYCNREGKIPLLSIEAIHDLHIFIFALATTHVFLSVKTIALAGAKMRKWKYWEDSIHEEILKDDSVSLVISPIHQTQFMVDGDRGINYYSVVMTWVHSFFKQFFSSLSHSEYRKMRLGFIMTHCNGNLKFDFYSYMVRAVEEDYKKVVGISWYLWIYVIFFLLMNIGGWHEYFWLSFVPLILLLTVGTKLEQIMGEMFKDVSGDRSIYKGEIVINPSDQYFWFHRPRILLFCIHLILFIVAFQFAYFFCILIAYGYSSCIMDKTKYVVPRLVVSFGVRVIASYSILPLYAIVTQMGSSCKPAIFEEHVKEGLVRWAQQARMRTKRSTTRKPKEEDAKIEIDSTHSDSLVEEGGAGIVQEPGPDSLHRPTMGSCV